MYALIWNNILFTPVHTTILVRYFPVSKDVLFFILYVKLINPTEMG